MALVVGDGLSSAAIEANALDCLEAIKGGLKAYGLEAGPALFIKFCRVGASDHIGDLTGAEVVCMLVGERPGLVTNQSSPPISPTSPTSVSPSPSARWSPTSTGRGRLR